MAILKALIAALAFGLSAPLAKRLLDVVPPLFLAGLLYLGAGVFLGLARLVWRRRPATGRPLTVRDRWILAAVVLAGGVLAPPLLLWGLQRSTATTTALLLNLEVVFTVVLAGIVFNEHLGARVAVAAVVMAAGGAVLGWTPGGPRDRRRGRGGHAGVPALGARQQSDAAHRGGRPAPPRRGQGSRRGDREHRAGSRERSGLARPGSDRLRSRPRRRELRHQSRPVHPGDAELGAARAGAYFATAPFFGAAGGLVWLGESLTAGLLGAAALMASATWLLVHERHLHSHDHPTGIHIHVHVHDEHHQHVHEGWEDPEPHSHPHPTGPLAHEHPHTPDIHHDHGHGSLDRGET